MRAKMIIEKLLARFEEPTCKEQAEAVAEAKAFLQEGFSSGATPLTDEAIKDSFQTGPFYKVKADAMRRVERELFTESQIVDWLDDNLSPEESERLFGEEVEVGQLRQFVIKQIGGAS